MSRVRVRGWWLLAILTLAILAVPWPAWLVEAVYSRGIYPRIQRLVTALSNRVSWAVIDVLVAGLAMYLVWRLARIIGRARESGVVSALWEFSRRILRTAAFVAMVLLTLWGLNYRRTPLERTLRKGADVTVSADDIRALAERGVAGTRITRPADDAPIDRTYASVAARLAGPFQEALRRLGMPADVEVGRPKTSLTLTPFFTAAGVTGMVNPFALESIVHPGLLPFERPMVLAHEWAHLAGFADEADASAVAWLACTLGDQDLAYSAHMFVVLESASAMPGSVWRELRAVLEPGVVEDIAALAARLTKMEPAVRDRAFKVYDGYLRSNRVPDGVRSYSRALRVLVAMRAAEVAGAPGGRLSPAESPPLP